MTRFAAAPGRHDVPELDEWLVIFIIGFVAGWIARHWSNQDGIRRH
jgi:hypothetical protein